MLHIVLLETALELVPPEISAKKPVQRHAHRRKKSPNELLLDQSYHGQAMTQLQDGDRRGRPDILYFCLQSILETPLCKEHLLSVHPDVRVPRNYERFVGLMEQLLLKGQVPPEGEALLQVTSKTLESLLSEIRKGSEETVSLLAVEGGQPTNMQSLLNTFPADSNIPVILGVGVFPHGDFTSNARDLFTSHIELDPEVMMAWHVW